MLIYQRYIIYNLLFPFCLLTIILTGIVWITQIFKLLPLIDRGINLTNFIYLVTLVLPFLLFIILPFVTIIAIIYTYNKLGEERQLIILKNSGLNNFKVAAPALIVAGLVTLLAYYISAQLLPWSYTNLKTSLNSIKQNFASSFIAEKTFNQLSKHITFYVSKKLPAGALEGLIVFDNRDDLNPTIIFAKEGNLEIQDSHLELTLCEGSRQAYDSNGNLTKLYFDNLSLEINKMVPDDSNQNLYNRDINEYYITELLDIGNQIPEYRRAKLIVEGHQRLIWPFYSLILSFLGLAVFLRQPYNKKSHIREVALTSLAILIVTFLHFTILNISAKNLNFIYGCYINIFSALLFSIYLYRPRNI